MQTTSDLYKTLLHNQNHEKEIKLNIAGVEYGMGNIISCSTSGGIFSEPGIGNCTSRQIQLEIFPIEEIPRQAQIQIFVRLVLSEQISEWIPKGVFFISTREKNKLTGALKITGYDAMLKTEQTWLTADYATNVWPMSQADAAADIASRISVEIDSRTVLSADYPVEYPTGENGDLTMREVLGYIATSNAGNWIITDDGKLRLIGYADTPAEDDEEALNKTNLGNHVSSLDYGEKISRISRINLVVDSNNMYTAGDDTGRTLETACSWGTQAMANSILAKVSGVDYRPYDAADALLDPAAEIGDGVSIADIYSVIATSSITFGKMCEANISAPYTDEIDDEYPYKTPEQRKSERQLAQTRSLISKTAEKITLSIEGLDERVSKIELNEQDITLSVSNSETSSTIKLMAGETELSSQTIKMTGLVTIAGLSGGTTTIDGACIKTGKISADRIDVGDLKFQTLWGSISKKAIVSAENAIYIGGDESIMSFSDVYIRGTNITFNAWSAQSKGLLVSPVSSTLEPVIAKEGKIGSSSKPFGEVHCGKLYLNGSELDPDRSKLYYSSTVYATLNSDKELVGSSQYYSLGNKNTPWANGYFTKLYLGGDELRKDRVSQSTSVYAELNASKQFVPALSAGYSMGSIGTPWATGYFTKLYLNGKELTTSASVSKLVNGSNSVELNASKQLVPYTDTGYSLGSSSYPFESCYLGKGTIQIGANSLSTGTKIGFYGATPIVRQKLSTTSQDMGYTSATSSNYLKVLNNVCGILKKLGLIGV